MTPLRINVLLLVGAGYVTLIAIFAFMALPGGMTADKAYEVVKGPLMALIGGSLAISKDLIPFNDGQSNGQNVGPNNPDDSRKNQPANEDEENK